MYNQSFAVKMSLKSLSWLRAESYIRSNQEGAVCSDLVTRVLRQSLLPSPKDLISSGETHVFKYPPFVLVIHWMQSG